MVPANCLYSSQDPATEVQQGRQEAKGASNIHTWGTKITNFSVTILPVFGGKCDSENLVGSAHTQPWWPPAENMGPL